MKATLESEKQNRQKRSERETVASELLSTARVFAAAVSAIASFICLGALFFSGGLKPLSPDGLNLLSLGLQAPLDTSMQRLGHLIAVGLIAVVAVISPVFGRAFSSPGFSAVSSASKRLVIVAVVVFAWMSYFWWWQDLQFLVLGIVSAPLVALMADRLIDEKFQRYYLFIALVLLGLAALPGLLAPLDLSGQNQAGLFEVQRNYANLFLDSDRLVDGQRLGNVVRPPFGVFAPVVLSLIQKAGVVPDFQFCAQLIRACQIIYLIAGAGLYWSYSRRNYRFAALIALAFLLPWYQFNNQSLLFPYNSAWTFLGFPIGLSVVWMTRGWRGYRLGLVLGFTAGLAILHNPGSGLALLAGFLAYMLYSQRAAAASTVSGTCVALVSTICGLTLAGLLFCLLCMAGPGYLPEWQYIQTLIGAGLDGKFGFAGMAGSFRPLPALIFIHSSFALVGSFLKPVERDSFRAAFAVAVSAMIVVWFAYYVQVPSPWFLVSFLFLYGFLLIDLLSSVLRVSAEKRLPDPVYLAPFAALAVILLPKLYQDWSGQKLFYDQGWQTIRHGALKKPASKISGIFVSGDLAGEINKKAEFIKAAASHGPVAYLTADCFLIPRLSGVVSSVGAGDLLSQTIRQSDYEKLVATIGNEGPEILYLDDLSGCESALPQWSKYLAALKEDICARYEKTSSEAGWEIWQRI